MSGRKRSLSHVGGDAQCAGDEHISGWLARAMERASAAPEFDLTHVFHSYAGRMHPIIGRSLLLDEQRPQLLEGRGEGDSARVLDPFCGSGTVLVEAMAAGLPSVSPR